MEARKALRLGGYDYSAQGVYFLTLCTHNRRCILSAVGRDDLVAPCVCLTEIGAVVDRYIGSIPRAYPNVAVDCYIVMPNHVHLLLRVSPCDGAPGSSRPTALIPRVIAALKRFTNREAGSKLWQTSYYDHIIRDEADYTVRYNYILDNPARWAEDEYFIP